MPNEEEEILQRLRDLDSSTATHKQERKDLAKRLHEKLVAGGTTGDRILDLCLRECGAKVDIGHPIYSLYKSLDESLAAHAGQFVLVAIWKPREQSCTVFGAGEPYFGSDTVDEMHLGVIGAKDGLALVPRKADEHTERYPTVAIAASAHAVFAKGKYALCQGDMSPPCNPFPLPFALMNRDGHEQDAGPEMAKFRHVFADHDIVIGDSAIATWFEDQLCLRRRIFPEKLLISYYTLAMTLGRRPPSFDALDFYIDRRKERLLDKLANRSPHAPPPKRHAYPS